MPAELAACVERANLDPQVHVIALAGNGKGFCGGYDLVVTAEQKLGLEQGLTSWPTGSPMDPKVQLANHDPDATWDPVLDYAMMSRNVRGFMSLFHSDKPVICKVHGFCVAGGTDMALCCDLLIIEDRASIGYPPARVWGVPTTALWAYRIGVEKAKRLLFTGDCLTGKQALEWGLATEAPPAKELDERFERSTRARSASSHQSVGNDEALDQSNYAGPGPEYGAGPGYDVRWRRSPHSRRLCLSKTSGRGWFQASRQRTR